MDNSGASEGEDGMERGTGFGVGNDSARVELNGACGECGDFGFAVETHDHSATGAIDFVKSFCQPGNSAGVESGGGFVEKQHGGSLDQGAGNGDALAHAAGESANERGAAVVETNIAEKFFGARGRLGHVLESGKEDEVLFGGEFVIDHSGVRDVAGGAIASGFRRSAGEGQFPSCGTNDAGSDAQKRGFAGTVAASEDDAFTGSNFETDTAKSEKPAETLIDVFEEQSGWR